jgi:hypothetical protein
VLVTAVQLAAPFLILVGGYEKGDLPLLGFWNGFGVDSVSLTLLAENECLALLGLLLEHFS